jgi:hypothetical protein
MVGLVYLLKKKLGHSKSGATHASPHLAPPAAFTPTWLQVDRSLGQAPFRSSEAPRAIA